MTIKKQSVPPHQIRGLSAVSHADREGFRDDVSWLQRSGDVDPRTSPLIFSYDELSQMNALERRVPRQGLTAPNALRALYRP
jgi:hypothetical protein